MGSADLEALPRDEADGTTTQPRRARNSREHRSRTGDESATRMIQIVEVMIMAQEDGIERAKRVRTDGRIHGFPQRVGGGGVDRA